MLSDMRLTDSMFAICSSVTSGAVSMLAGFGMRSCDRICRRQQQQQQQQQG
jgi:hypothetical protein